MKNTLRWTLLLLVITALCGCASAKKSAPTSSSPANVPKTERMLIWKANLHLEVGNVTEAAKQATSLAEAHGGYVENQSDQGESACSTLTLRVPSKTFRDTLESLEKLGSVKSRSLTGEDVTEKYVDVEARLKNKIALRNKLKALLEKATNVNDSLAIEKELSKVQSDIDSMEAQIKSMKGQTDYATIVLTLERRSIPGPLGAVFRGIGWVFEKLFFIRQ